MKQNKTLLEYPGYFPEWMEQRVLIQSGECSWEDFTYEERTCRGWLIPYLLEIESLFADRWNFWSDQMDKGGFTGASIPKIRFTDIADSETMKMLTDCMDNDRVYSHSNCLPDFFEWLLWGFGDRFQKERPRMVGEKVNEHWYKTFNLVLMLEHPHDYLGDMLAEVKSVGRSYWNNPNAFYPTPHPVCEMMAQMNFAKGKRKVMRSESVIDPCVGSGRMLMHASNFSVNLYGIDIDRTCVMATLINGYLYIPWLVRPAPWLHSAKPVEHKNSLTGEKK